MKWYCVCTAVYGNGKMTAGIVDTVEAETAPANSVSITRHKDIYTDWYDNIETAQEMVRDARG